ncbi:hypothetical protein KFE25_005186 [Diacronema lutheri]|uniref:Uncharacterized protein n=1 Tax=Diacronema lutheri TaxID=2081491 RepID=A0A8J5X5K1_DIALT|nr:hypothetical protein KFE25_005186 [Diacronema lutheri]
MRGADEPLLAEPRDEQQPARMGGMRDTSGPLNEALLAVPRQGPPRRGRRLPAALLAVGVVLGALCLAAVACAGRPLQAPPPREGEHRRPAAARPSPPAPPAAPPTALLPPPAAPAAALPECTFAKANGQHGTSTTRRVEFANECSGDLMVNLQGFTWFEPANFSMHELPDGGGFALPAGERVDFNVSERLFSGRIWARPNCTSPCNPLSCGPRGRLWCDTGNCPGADETTCRGERGEFIGGLPPGPLLELTLCGGRGANRVCYADDEQYDPAACAALPFADFYDLSNVDGTSTVWASLTPLGGRRLRGPGAPSDAYNCGAPTMPGAFDLARCPQPLRIRRNDSDAFGFSVNAPLADAIGCLSACSFMTLVGRNFVANRTALSRRNVSGPVVGPVTADDIAATCCECGHGGDNGVCPAPRPDGTWPPPNDKCIAGCSPFGAYPSEYAPSRCSTEHMPAILLPAGAGAAAAGAAAGGRAGAAARAGGRGRAEQPAEWLRLGDHQALFKQYAPDAYSWQFDDAKSTYMCERPDYRITFCPRSSLGKP